MLRQRQPREHDEKHCAFIRSLPCICCKDNTSTEAAHVRFSDPRASKDYTGKSEKPHDKWTLPLCGRCHRLQHDVGEKIFWEARKIEPLFVALALYSVSGDHQAGEQIVNAW